MPTSTLWSDRECEVQGELGAQVPAARPSQRSSVWTPGVSVTRASPSLSAGLTCTSTTAEDLNIWYRRSRSASSTGPAAARLNITAWASNVVMIALMAPSLLSPASGVKAPNPRALTVGGRPLGRDLTRPATFQRTCAASRSRSRPSASPSSPAARRPPPLRPERPPAAPQSNDLLNASRAPYIVSQSILAASDLETLRGVTDAMRDRELLGEGAGQCRPPYVEGRDVCWPGATSQPGRAYLALALADGWCQFPSRPQLYLLPGRRLLLEVGFSKGFCYGGAAAAPLAGVHLVAASVPRASLVSISTTGLEPGLYAVSYRFLSASGTYDSDATYLSVPAPAAASQSTVEAQAAAIGANGGAVSVARVAGDQVRDLCGMDVAGPAFLLTTGTELWLPHRQMTVVLAGPTPRTCVVTSI